MRSIGRKFIESIIVHGVFSIVQIVVQILVTAGAAVIVPVFAGAAGGAIVAAIEACLAALFVLGISNVFIRRQYPKCKFDFVHTCNRYALSFQSREVMEYSRRLVAKPLREGLEAFKDGEYTWTGSKSEPKLIDEDNNGLKLEPLPMEPGSSTQKYTVKADSPLKQYKNCAYTVCIMLEDANRRMDPKNSIYIKRPTDKIILELNHPSSVGIKNVKLTARSELGDQRTFHVRKGKAKVQGGDVIQYLNYTFVVRRPKLSCEYAVRWEWE